MNHHFVRIMTKAKEVSPVPGISCLVFRTSLKDKDDVGKVSGLLNILDGITDWHVDLEDREKVLRIECTGLTAANIIDTLHQAGVSIKELPV